MLPQAQPSGGNGASWVDVVCAHLGARRTRVIAAADAPAVLAELRHRQLLAPLAATTYPDSDVLRVAPEVSLDVDPSRFVTSASAVSGGVLHRWMSAAWVEKRFWRALRGAADGGEVVIMPIELSAVGRSQRSVVVTDNLPLVASLLRMTSLAKDAAWTEDAARVVAVSGRVPREERFICLSIDEKVLWSCGWYSGPAQVVEESLAVGFPALEWSASRDAWAAPATVARCDDRRSSSAATIAFVGGAGDERLIASCGASTKRFASQLLGDGPHWFVRSEHGLRCASPLRAARLPLRALRASSAASVLARLHRSLLFTNAAITETQLPWWEERGDPPPPGEVVDWGGMLTRPSSDRRRAHLDASVVVPYELLRDSDAVAMEGSRSSGEMLDAIVFVVEVHTPDALLLEARNWSEAIALAVGFDALGTGHVRDPLGLRSFPADASAGLQAWLNLAAANGPRAFIWTVPRHAKAGSAEKLQPGEVTALVSEAVRGHPAAATSPLGDIRASSRSRIDARSVVDALARALDELGSRCPPDLRRAHHSLANAVEQA
jgi:GTP-dependent phosphoenolpyruvate carboxykinase